MTTETTPTTPAETPATESTTRAKTCDAVLVRATLEPNEEARYRMVQAMLGSRSVLMPRAKISAMSIRFVERIAVDLSDAIRTQEVVAYANEILADLATHGAVDGKVSFGRAPSGDVISLPASAGEAPNEENTNA